VAAATCSSAAALQRPLALLSLRAVVFGANTAAAAAAVAAAAL